MSNAESTEALRAEIAERKVEVRTLDRQRAVAQGELRRLEAELAALEDASPVASSDASAFREACKSAGVPVSIERSRSGNGAHAWFFFEAPVPAVTARRMASFLLPRDQTDYPIQRIYQLLATDQERNDLILNDVIQALEDGRSPIVLTERKDHLEFLADRLRGFTRHLVVLKGGGSAKRRRETLTALKEIPGMEERLVLATGRYIGEGFDDARLEILAEAPLATRSSTELRGTIVHRDRLSPR